MFVRRLKTLPAKTVPTASAEPVATSERAQGAVVQADDANTAIVRVGGPEVTTANGIALAKNDSIYVNATNPAEIFCVSAVAAQKVQIMIFDPGSDS